MDVKNPNEIPPITLTLDQDESEIWANGSAQLQLPTHPAKDAQTDGIILTDSERKQVSDLAQKIDLRDSKAVLQYASSAQKKIADFADSTLSRYKVKDSGEIGTMLLALTSELKGFTVTEEPKKGFFSFFSKGADTLTTLKARYETVEATVNKVVDDLEQHKIQLLKDISMLDHMYEINLNHFKELTMYIMAAKEKLEAAEKNELPALRQKALQSGSQLDLQELRDYEDMYNRFDKKIHDLQLSKAIALQLAPQIRLIQNNDSILADKIQSSIANTIPLWKNQIVLALGLANSQKALGAQRVVSDVTNELLKKNADMLRMNSTEISREAERGIIDLETIRYTNDQLIATLDEVMQIQEEGKQRRRLAEGELVQIQNDLRNKLLAMKG